MTKKTGAFTVATPTATIVIANRSNADLATRDDLLRGLDDENVAYVPQHRYVATTATLKAIDPTLDWGGKLTVFVLDALPGDNGAVCLQEASTTGRVFAIAEIASGPDAGVYANVGDNCAFSTASLASPAWNTGWNQPSDFATQSDLVRALVVENAVRTSTGAFSTDVNALKALDPSLD